jgi:hypothetical protein
VTLLADVIGAESPCRPSVFASPESLNARLLSWIMHILSIKMEPPCHHLGGVRKALLYPLFGRLSEVEDEAQGRIKSSQLLERQMARAFT